MTDPSIVTTACGIWAVKWSFAGLLVTALLQAVIVWRSGSVALLADTIHNFGDASTALPLWIAFMLARLKPTARFPFGYGRAEDLAGVVIVLTIFFSAIVAGYESINRLFHPQQVEYLWAVAAASVIGFIGNEAVAVIPDQGWQGNRQHGPHRRRLPSARGQLDQSRRARRRDRGLARVSAG